MAKRIINTIILLLTTVMLNANGFHINVTWQGLSDTTILLARYYDSNIYIADSIKLNAQGKGQAKADTLLNQGLYMLYLDGNNFVDFLLGEKQQINISTRQNQLIEALQVEGAPDSEKFAFYQKYIRQKNEEKNKLLKQLDEASDIEKESLKKQIDAIDNDMLQYMDNVLSSRDNSMFSLFVRAANPIRIPESEISPKHPKHDSIVWFNAYNYRRDHFLSGFDFSDERILNTPLVKPRLDTYFNQILIQTPDSIIPQALKLLRTAEANKKTYQYLSQYLINSSSSSKIMGMDAVFVAVADEVYLSGKATWADDETLRKVVEEVFLTRPNLIGNKAPELVMENIDGEYVSLHQLPSTYTIIVFYEYNCGHCKRDIPGLYNNVFMKYLANNVDVFAVCMNDDHEEWKEFIEEHELTGWHNVWDPRHETQFRFKYNTRTSPLIYLLDRDKKILAKRIDQNSLSQILDSLINN